MTENTNTNMTQVADTTSSRGAQWAGAGSLIALAANSLLGGGNGGLLGNVFGGNGVYNQQAMNALMDENTKLKADMRTDSKIYDVTSLIYQKDKAQDAALYALDKRLSSIETAAPLREQILCGKIDSVAAAAQCGIAQNSAAITCLQNTVNSITKISVPNAAICPGWGSVTITPSVSGTTV